MNKEKMMGDNRLCVSMLPENSSTGEKSNT